MPHRQDKEGNTRANPIKDGLCTEDHQYQEFKTRGCQQVHPTIRNINQILRKNGWVMIYDIHVPVVDQTNSLF